MPRAQVSRWGHSLAVRIPRALAEQVGVEEGTEVELRAEGEGLVLAKRSYSLRGLLKGVTPENLHGEWDTGERVGREVW